MNKRQHIQMLLAISSSVDVFKYNLDILKQRSEHWIGQRENVEGNTRYLKEFALPLEKRLQGCENLWQLYEIVNSQEFK